MEYKPKIMTLSKIASLSLGQKTCSACQVSCSDESGLDPSRSMVVQGRDGDMP